MSVACNSSAAVRIIDKLLSISACSPDAAEDTPTAMTVCWRMRRKHCCRRCFHPEHAIPHVFTKARRQYVKRWCMSRAANKTKLVSVPRHWHEIVFSVDQTLSGRIAGSTFSPDMRFHTPGIARGWLLNPSFLMMSITSRASSIL